MRRLFFFGAPDKIDGDPTEQPMLAYQRTGNNTGNLLIGHALSKHLECDVASRNRALPPEQIQAEFDAVVIPAANFLCEKFDLQPWVDFLKPIDLPCVIVGVGAQASDYDPRIPLKPGTREFLDIVADRSVTIGVRGHFTAECFDQLGIKNVDVIGCPSLFWNGRSRLEIEKKPVDELRRIAITGDRTRSPKLQGLQQMLLNEAMRYDSHYIAQNELPEIHLALGHEPPQGVSWVTGYYKGAIAADAVEDFFRTRSRVFFSIPEWANAIRGYDFSIGLRFHGNMIALQNGVPAVVLTHDSRTRELCELMHIPFLQTKDVEHVSLEWMYRLADFTAMSAAYPSLLENYRAFLRRNGLSTSLEKLDSSKSLPCGGDMQSYRLVQRAIQDGRLAGLPDEPEKTTTNREAA